MVEGELPKPEIKGKLGGQPDPRWDRARRGLPVEFDPEPTHNDLLRQKEAEARKTPRVEPKPRSKRTGLRSTTSVQESEADPTKHVPTVGEYINHRQD